MFTRYPFRNVTLIADYSKLIPCSSSSSFRVAAEKLAVEFTPAEYKHTHLQMFHPCSSINFSFCCYYLPAYRFLADVLSEGECWSDSALRRHPSPLHQYVHTYQGRLVIRNKGENLGVLITAPAEYSPSEVKIFTLRIAAFGFLYNTAVEITNIKIHCRWGKQQRVVKAWVSLNEKLRFSVNVNGNHVRPTTTWIIAYNLWIFFHDVDW